MHQLDTSSAGADSTQDKLLRAALHLMARQGLYFYLASQQLEL